MVVNLAHVGCTHPGSLFGGFLFLEEVHWEAPKEALFKPPKFEPIRVIGKVLQLGGENGQFRRNRASKA